MRFEIDASDVLAKAGALERAGDRMLEDLEPRLAARGAEGVRFMQRRFRTGGTTATRTAQRTGGLYDAYDSELEPAGESGARGFDLHLGLIKPGEDDQVLLRGRVHEGYGAAGQRIDEFVIVPRKARHLVFKTADGHWVTTDRVVLKPRPTFPDVIERLPPFLQQDVSDAFNQAVRQ